MEAISLSVEHIRSEVKLVGEYSGLFEEISS